MVGVIANLAVYFALHTLFVETVTVDRGASSSSFEVPRLDSVQLPALAITAIACALIFARRWSALRTLGVCAMVGIAVQLAASSV